MKSNPADATVLGTLSRREREVFDLLVSDISVADIGAALGISPKTVAVHKHNLCAKVGATTRVGLVLLSRGATSKNDSASRA